MILSFRDLEVYNESFQLSVEIEDLLKTFPPFERYLLIDQMRRASRAIPALIAEGWSKRESIKEFQKYLKDALGETNEMVNHLLFSQNRKYIKKIGYADELISRYEILAKKITNLKNNWQNFKVSKD